MLYICFVTGTAVEELSGNKSEFILAAVILTLATESIYYREEQSSLSLGCTPFWNYEQTAQSSFDNHSSTL